MSDINNGSRRAIEYLVYGALPPHSTKVLWMDTSVPELPVLKIFWNGCWTPVHTDESKEIDLLVKTVFAQQETIQQLEDVIGADVSDIKHTVDTVLATEENATANKNEIIQEIDEKALEPSVTYEITDEYATLMFNNMSPYQVSKMIVLSNKGHIKFEIVDYGETSSLCITSDSPAEIAGTTILSHFSTSAIYTTRGIYVNCPADYTFLNAEAPQLGVLGNILNSDISWRVSDIENRMYQVQDSLENEVAKQGPDSTTSLTGVNNKIDRFYDTFDADIALQLQNIIGGDEEIEGNSQTEEQVQELRTLQQSISDLANGMTNLVNSHTISGMSYDGMVFEGSYSPANPIFFLRDLNTEVKVIDDSELPADQKIVSIPGGNPGSFLSLLLGERTCNAQIERIKLSELREIISTWRFFSQLPLLRSIELPKLETYNGAYSLEGCPYITELNLPELRTIGGRISHSSNLQVLKAPKLTTVSTSFVYNTRNLIDFETGAYFTTNMNLSAWDPTNALDASSSSLINPGESFANNREKLLYNIREHFAANLQDLTGETSLTITFSANMKAAIQADTATSNAFTNKNWTIA